MVLELEQKKTGHIIEIRQAIERLEADRTASRKKEDNQPKLTAFYMSSTCSNSKKLDSDTDSESTMKLFQCYTIMDVVLMHLPFEH